MYVCGPTVYDEPHLGHLRSAYVFDLIRRYLEYSGYRVKFVRNVTDVDDKIIEKARESDSADLMGEARKVSEKYLDLYREDLGSLGIQEPTVEPKATAHIQDMRRLIQKLIDAGKAYVSEGDVYFDVNRFGGYGKLSHQNKEAILQNVRIEKNPKKRDALDFTLWKKAKEGEPSWPSPWGAGRPGWHIECSAMSMKYLGESFDIHGGGRDLIFPHHENEIAQSESITGSQFARYWIHHGLITVKEQKMSKSIKNYITLKQVSSGGPTRIEELKFLFLGTHYSAPLDYSEEKMKMERSIRERFFFFFQEAEERAKRKSAAVSKIQESRDFKKDFGEIMDDDFNTPQAMALMHEMVDHARKSDNSRTYLEISRQLREFANIFGVFSGGSDREVEAYVQHEIKRRDAAKKSKDYKLADEIRDKLLREKGIALMDTANGIKWIRV